MLQSVIVILSNLTLAIFCVFFVSTLFVAAILKKRGLVKHRLAAVNIAPYIDNAISLVKAGDRELVVTYKIWKASLMLTLPLFLVLIILLLLRDIVFK